MVISEERKRLNEKYKWVIREGVTKCLRRHGFARKGANYWRDHDPTVTCVIAAARPPYGSAPGRVEFWFRCGMSVKAYAEIFPEHRWWAEDPVKAPMQLDVYPGMLSKEAAEYRIAAETSEEQLAALAQTITRHFETIVLPWYAQFRSALEVGDYLASPEKGPGRMPLSYREIPQQTHDLRDAAIAYFGAGAFDKARAVLDLCTRTIDPAPGYTADLRDHIERAIARRDAQCAKA
jgi:hypothetical protein